MAAFRNWMIGRLVGRFTLAAALALSGCIAGRTESAVEIMPVNTVTATEPSAVPEHGDFWEAMAWWDLSYVRAHEVSSEQGRYAEALASLERGDTDRCLEIARGLWETGSEPMARRNARRLVNTVYASKSRWDLLIPPASDQVASTDDPNAGALLEDLRQMPTQECEFHKPISQIPGREYRGILLLPVQINGQSRSLALDTGADLTILADDVARACKVDVKADSSHPTHTFDGQIVAKVGRVDRLDIGGLTIRSHPVLGVPARNMLTRRTRIDGVLGWPAIRAMDIEIDYDSSMVTIRDPKPGRDVEANLLPCHRPVVRVRTPAGMSAPMLLDTASTLSFFYKGTLSRLGLGTTGRTRQTIITPGRRRTVELETIPTLCLILGSTQAQWTNMLVFDTHAPGDITLKPAGVLGNDIFRDTGRLRIDWMNRRVDFWWDPASDHARARD